MAVVTATFHAFGRTYVEGDELADNDDAVKRYPAFFTVTPKPAKVSRPAKKAAGRTPTDPEIAAEG